MIIVKSSDFVTAAAAGFPMPDPTLPEVAFAGRSNVGKSSVLNLLTNRKKLARVSRTPGRTRQINFFLINRQFFMVDLPGYGFAKGSHAETHQWQALLDSYFKGRRTFLKVLVLLIDIRRGLTDLDRMLSGYITELGFPIIPVLTKSDKAGRAEQNQVREAVGREFPGAGAPILFSLPARRGQEELWERLEPYL
jgi:GTP-binding protein